MPKIIIVRHHDGDLDDTASTHLSDSHYEIENWFPFKQPSSDYMLTLDGVAGTIVMGGAQNVTDIDSLPYLQLETDWILKCIAADIPVVGICLGSQLVANALGGKVTATTTCEFGYEAVHPTGEQDWIPETHYFTQAHFQGFSLPPDCIQLASGENFPVQAFQHKDNVFGFQFHPEVHSTMFEEWMASEFAHEFYATPGCQSPSEQARLNKQHNDKQTAWFKTFLSRILPPVSIAH